jgi:hypothetical protein
MNGSTLRHLAGAFAGLGTASLALGQEVAGQAPPWSFITGISAVGMLLPIAIIGIIFYNERRKDNERVAAIERLVTAGHTVPPELAPGPPRVTLPEERRRDVRRGITLLCWGLAVALTLYLTSGLPRAAAWGLLFLIPSLGSFLKAKLTARELARGAAHGAR